MVLLSAQFIYSSKYCIYELPIFIEKSGCVVCFQLSKYLKEIWNFDAWIAKNLTNTKKRIGESRNLNRDLCNDWMIICLYEEKNPSNSVLSFTMI